MRQRNLRFYLLNPNHKFINANTTFCIFAKSNPVVHPSIAKAAGAYVASYGLGLDIGAGSDSDERS